MGIQTVKPSKLLRGQSRRLQGINSKFDDVRLLTQKWRGNVTDAVLDATLERSIEASSTLAITVHDPDGRLRRSKLLEGRYDLEVDKLHFRFAGAERQDDTLVLNHEAREVAKLRAKRGAVKVPRGKTTRAEFCVMLIREVRPLIPVFCPELHTRQPIRKAKESREDEIDRDVRRDTGIGEGVKLTVKGAAASASQLQLGDRVLRIAASYGAPFKACVALIVACIVESEIQNLSGGEGTSSGVLQVLISTAASLGISARDVEACVRVFLRTGFTGAGGAIEHAKKGIGPAESAQLCQGSAFPERYRQYVGEAEEWVREFFGGEEGSTSLTVSREVTKRYQFQRGGPDNPGENTWACLGRLMEEVRWRRFESAGIVYLIAETDLLRSRIRMQVNDEARGIDAINWRYDVGRRVSEVTVTGRAKTWAAPPGTVVMVGDQGPADGRYIVSSIRKPLTPGGRIPIENFEATLKRPTKPLPEPAPETVTRTSTISVPGTGGEGADVSAEGGDRFDRMVAEAERINQKRIPYVFGGGHVTPAPPNGPFDCSSAVSRILQYGGFDIPTMTTVGLATFGAEGTGKLVTIWVRNGGPGGGHTLMRLGDRFWGTSSTNAGGGPGWLSEQSPSYLAGFQKRHPPGM